MSADLHIHVVTEDLTEDDFLLFLGNSLGSHYFCGLGTPNDSPQEMLNRTNRLHILSTGARDDLDTFKKFAETPSVWVGEVSWLKSALFENEEDQESAFIPAPVQRIHDLIPDYPHPELTPELRNQILAAFNQPHGSSMYSVAQVTNVAAFLDAHLGKKIFTVSW
jgi:hypothetical protein